MSIKRNAAETLGYLGANKKRKIDKRESGELEEDASEEEVEEDVAEKKSSELEEDASEEEAKEMKVEKTWLCPGILSATHHSLAPATHDLAGHPFSYPRNRLNPAEAPRTAAQRFFDLPDLTFSVVDQAVRSDVPFDLTDGFAFQAFNDLVEGTYLSTAAFRLAFRRRWEVNTFVETCDIHNQPSLSTPPLYAANMWSVQFIFEVDVDAGAQNDYDFSWADLHAIAPLFTSLRTASFFVDFVQDDVIDFVNEDLANLTGVEGMLAHVVDGIRTSLPRVGNRRIAIEDAESGDVTSDGDASGLAPAQVAPLLLDNLAIAYRI